MERVQGSVRLQ